MHASRLVEIAAIASLQHGQIRQQKVNAEFWGAEQFWVLSRARVNEWSRLLKSCNLLRPQKEDFDPPRFWAATSPVLEEFFLAEVCTRIWCATLSVIDADRLHGELDPIARSAFVANLEVRRHALRLLLFARGLPMITTTSLNMLRRDCEIWTDNFLASFTPVQISQQYCFERKRLTENARRFKRTSAKLNGERHAQELLATRCMLASRAAKPAVCGELNCEIAGTILGCLPATAFDSCGIPRPGWSTHGFQTDLLSIDVLVDLCGNLSTPRYDIPGGLRDRR